jgi:hypothetical protein
MDDKYKIPTASTWKDLTGKVFDRLTVLGFLHNNKWECQCSCGNISEVNTYGLNSGRTKSCGCLHKELVGNKFRTHGLYGTPEYVSWNAMKNRCSNKSSPVYFRYGGRGITVCQRWLDSFENFLEDMGSRPSDTTLDRIDVNKGYNKDNCRWANNLTQANNKTSTHLITLNGETMSVMEWCRRLNYNYGVIQARLHKLQWSVEDAFSKPTKAPFNR